MTEFRGSAIDPKPTFSSRAGGLKHPVRCLNIIKDDVGYLKKEPGGDDIGNRYPEDVAALEFFDKGHIGLFVAIGGVHSACGLKHGPIEVIFLVSVQILVGQQHAGTDDPEGAVIVRSSPKADIKLIGSGRSTNDPKRTFFYRLYCPQKLDSVENAAETV